MFIEALILAVILGYLLKGRLKNLGYVKLKGAYCVILPFLLESIMNLLVRMGYFHESVITLVIDIFLYFFLLYFTMLNRKNPFILIMGLGFLLNGIVIIINGGVMPVSYNSAIIAGLPRSANIRTIGLYRLIDANTRLWFLGDIFPINLGLKFIFSIGDTFISLGLITFVINGMKKTEE